MTESDSKLRHILGTFFPLYSSMSKQHQLAMEAAFIPTIKVLFDAPVTSMTTVHDSLAIAVCNKVLSSPDSFQTKVLINILTSLVK